MLGIKKYKVSKNDLIGYLLVVLLVLNGGTIIKVLELGSEFQIITMVVIMSTLLFYKRFNLGKFIKAVIILIPGFLILSFYHSLSSLELKSLVSNQVINFCVLIINGILVSMYFSSRKFEFLRILNNVLMILILHGIVSSLILTFFPTNNIIFTAVNEESISPYVGYSYLFFQRMHLTYLETLDTGVFSIAGINVYRAHGAFWEPGVFSVFANLFLFLNYFIFKNRRNVFIGVFGILLSWSTTGIIVLAIQTIVYFFSIFKFNIKGVLSFMIGSIIVALVFYISFWNIDDKIYGENSGSSAQRYADTMAAVEVVSNHPLFGIGVNFNLFRDKIKKAKPKFGGLLGKELDMDSVSENGFSNSLIRVFVYFGVPIGAFLLFCFHQQTLIDEKKWLFTVISFIGLSSSPILFMSFYFTFIVNGLMNQFRILNEDRFKYLKSAQRRYLNLDI